MMIKFWKIVIEWVRANEKPKLEQIYHLSEAHKYFWVRYESLEVSQEILYHNWEDTQTKRQIVLTTSLKNLF